MKTDVIPSLKNEPPVANFRKINLRDLIVAGQIALSVLLAISALLAVRSLQHALTMNLGFNPRNAVSISFDLRLERYGKDRSRRFDRMLLERARTLPGLQLVGIISNLPLRLGEDNDVFFRADRPIPPRAQWRGAVVYKVSPDYLRAAGTRLVAGRDVDGRDRENAPAVALVNEEVVHQLYGGESPIGKHLRLGGAGDQQVEIVGVVETGKYESLGEDPKPAVFRPIEQTGTAFTTVVTRTSLPADQATTLLRKMALALDPSLTIFNQGSVEEQLSFPLFPPRAAAIALSVFGVLALMLAGSGLFALTAYSVTQRRREIGIRKALGAQPFHVVWCIVKRISLLCGAGLFFGAAATAIAGRFLSAILYGIDPHDSGTFMAALILTMAVALGACWQPVARAMRLDPARTLRDQ